MNNMIPVLTVSQITQAIKLCLESTFPNIWIQGEVSNCKLQSSGHLYFCLKDTNAQIAAVMFRGDLSSLQRIPKDGDQLIVRGELNVYPPNGKYQLIVRELRLAGLGELLLKLEERKKKLQQLGWFDPARKRPLPKFPKKIGVVTSPTGAVIQDILHVLSRRFSGFQLILNPVKVQGEGAAEEIAKAIYQMNQYQLADVLIVGRGGGSLEDLWAFNEEIVAEAIYKSRIPIISAVGHETDYSIADFVADVRAPTPSAAAEIVIAEKAQQLNHLTQIQRRLFQTVQHLIRHDRQRLNNMMRHPLLVSPYGILGPWMQKLDDDQQHLDRLISTFFTKQKLKLEARHKQLEALKPTSKLQHLKQLLKQKQDRLNQAWAMQIHHAKKHCDITNRKNQLNQVWNRLLQLKKERLIKLVHSLELIDPKNLLTKGYCILFSEKDHSVITTIEAIKKEDDLRVLLSNGEIISTVKEIYPHYDNTIQRTAERAQL